MEQTPVTETNQPKPTYSCHFWFTKSHGFHIVVVDDTSGLCLKAAPGANQEVSGVAVAYPVLDDEGCIGGVSAPLHFVPIPADARSFELQGLTASQLGKLIEDEFSRRKYVDGKSISFVVRQALVVADAWLDWAITATPDPAASTFFTEEELKLPVSYTIAHFPSGVACLLTPLDKKNPKPIAHTLKPRNSWMARHGSDQACIDSLLVQPLYVDSKHESTLGEFLDELGGTVCGTGNKEQLYKQARNAVDLFYLGDTALMDTRWVCIRGLQRYRFQGKKAIELPEEQAGNEEVC